MKNIIKYIGLLIIPICMMAISCSDDNKYDTSDSPDLTVIHSIKIINGGNNRDSIIIGSVDEVKKEISFPKVPQAMSLEGLKFEAVVSDGARLDSATYNFVVAPGDVQRKRTIAVVNGTRKREYFLTIRLSVPVWGADFSEAKISIYDYSGRTTKYPDLAGLNTRCADMDDEHVLMVSRDGGNRPHLLKISDIQAGNINPIMLDMTGVSGGGTFVVSAGRLQHGQIYICSLTTPGAASPFKVYNWASPTAIPTLIGEFLSTDIPGYGAGRFGDYMSVDLDENGDGYMFFGVNGNQAAYKVLRVKVTGFTTTSDPELINLSVFGGLWANYNKVDGVDNQYLYTGSQAGIYLVNAAGAVAYTIPTTSIPQGSVDAHIFNFNRERYLGVMEVATGLLGGSPAAGSVTLYNITKGETIAEALAIFEAGDKAPIFKYSLGGSNPTGTSAGSFAWATDGDDVLYLFGAAPECGFVVIECPKKVEED